MSQAAALWPEAAPSDASPFADVFALRPEKATAAPADASRFADWLPAATPRFRWDWPHLRLMQARLQAVIDGESDREMFFVPPRHGKTEQNTVRFVAYVLERDPTKRVIVGAYNATLARKFSRKIRKLVRERGVELSTERNAVEDWETTAGGGVRAVGVGEGVTGQGGDVIVVDDPVKSRAEANSEAYRRRVWEWYSEDLYTRLEPGGVMLLTMTRWHPDDLAGAILASEDAPRWHVTLLPALADPAQTGGADPLGRRPGEALCPDRYTRPDLLAIRRVMEGWAFDALYQQRPTPKKGEFFNVDKLTYVDAVPANARRARGWDFGATEGGGDPTAGARISVTPDGTVYVEHVAKAQKGPGTRDGFILGVAEMDTRRVPQVGEEEPAAAGKVSAAAFLKLLAGWTVKVVPVSGDKPTRAGPFASQVNVGNVRLVRGPWNAAYVEELRQFPRGAHDDQVDASATAYNDLVAGAVARPVAHASRSTVTLR